MKTLSFFVGLFYLILTVNEAFADQNNAFFKGVEISAEIYNKSLRFTVKNSSDQDYMVVDDFCFDTKLHTIILDLPTFTERGDSFSNGISRKQGRMMRLKSHGERTCEIGYFENPQKSSDKATKGLVVWYTNLFIGDFNNRYSSREFSGSIAVSFPSIESNIESSQQLIDSSALSAYRMRKSLGVID